jgi:DHA1 family bicyclomycin/chloramphenicol resistance-like MFS transporter
MSMSVVSPSPGRTAVLVLQVAFGLVAMTLCLPALPEWVHAFGASQAAVQLSFSAYVAAYGGLQLVYGPWSDRLGRRPVLLFGLTLATLGFVLAALAPNLATLVVARALQGAGTAAGMVIGRALVQDWFAGHDRARVMAYIGMVMGLCPPVAALLGGYIHVQAGWRWGFVLLTALALVAWIAAWRSIPPGRPARFAQAGADEVPRHWLRTLATSYARLAREPAFLLYVVILASTTAAFYSFLSGAPLVLAGYGVAPQEVGWYIMAIPFPYVLGNLLTTRLVEGWGERRVMALGQCGVFLGLGLLLVLAWAGWRSPLSFALPLVFIGIGHGLLAPPTLAGTVSLVPALAGTAAAVAGMTQQLLGALAAYGVGLVSHEGPVNLGLMMLGMSLAGLLAQVLLFGWVLRRPRAEAQG